MCLAAPTSGGSNSIHSIRTWLAPGRGCELPRDASPLGGPPARVGCLGAGLTTVTGGRRSNLESLRRALPAVEDHQRPRPGDVRRAAEAIHDVLEVLHVVDS